MKKAVTAIIAVVVIGLAIWYMYGELKKLGYFSSPPPATAQPMQPGMMPAPGAPGAPAQPAAPAEGAPAQDTTATP